MAVRHRVRLLASGFVLLDADEQVDVMVIHVDSGPELGVLMGVPLAIGRPR